MLYEVITGDAFGRLRFGQGILTVIVIAAAETFDAETEAVLAFVEIVDRLQEEGFLV